MDLLFESARRDRHHADADHPRRPPRGPLRAEHPPGGWEGGGDRSLSGPRRTGHLMLALRLARRELRGGVRGLAVVLSCLALGVAVIAAVGTLRAATDRGLAEDGRRILGGDLEVEGGSQPLPVALRDWLRARGAALSDVVQMRSMLVAPSGERQLVELKAVDAAWPLVGEAAVRGSAAAPPPPTLSRKGRGSDEATEPPPPLAGGGRGEGGKPSDIAAALSNHGLLAEPVVLDRLNLRVGDTVRLGNASFTIRGALISEPDRVAAPLILGPRVLIAADALPSTGLIAPGSMVQYAHPSRTSRSRCRTCSACRSARSIFRSRLAHPRSARRRSRRHPFHRPDQPVHDACRPDFSAGRRYRRGQRRARLARRPRSHHRDAALSRSLVRPRVCALPDPGSGIGPVRHRHRACRRFAGATRACRRAQGRAAGARRSWASIPLRSPLRHALACSPRWLSRFGRLAGRRVSPAARCSATLCCLDEPVRRDRCWRPMPPWQRAWSR